MRLSALAREIWATAWASKVSSALTVAVAAAMCFAALVTVGRSASAAADVAARMEQAGARRLSVVDTRGQGFVNQRTLAVVRGLSTVESANALGVPFDVVNGAIGRGGVRVPAWPVLGEAADAVDVVRGRPPQPGEALVSVTMLDELNLAEPVGYLASPDGLAQFPIVGAFATRAPFDDLAAGAVVAGGSDTAGRELRVVIDRVTSARATVRSVLEVLAPVEQDGVALESPTGLAQMARQLEEQMSGNGRSLLLLILGVGGFFVAAVTLADVLIRRRDLGRRRTLGITRTDLTALVSGRALVTALIGAVVGCTAAVVTNLVAVGIATPPDFAVAVGVLATLTAGLSSLLPAFYATRLDPVNVMRTP